MIFQYFILVRNVISSILPQHHLCGNRSSEEVVFVLMTIMSELISETSKSFEPSIDSFMPTCNFLFCTLFALATIVCRGSDCSVTSVTSISFKFFAFSKHWFHKLSKNSDVWVFSSWKRTMTRNYFSSLNTCTDTVSKSRSFEFVAVECRVKWVWSPFRPAVVLRIPLVEDRHQAPSDGLAWY